MNRLTRWMPLAVTLVVLLLPSIALADIPSPGRCDSCAVGGPGGTAGDAIGLAALTFTVIAALRGLRRRS